MTATTYHDVPTKTIDVSGTRFAYRELGPVGGTPNGKAAARQFVNRLKERTNDRDKPISLTAFRNQLKAIHTWGRQNSSDLGVIHQPVLVANGDQDRMVPSINSADLARRLPDAQLTLYPDAGHGGIFQYHDKFVDETVKFLGP